ncbi:MAG: PD-(D/E)XK nuclease family protein, partial [Muribaculaceae bacterium]|nr:PD-(D/E)XK nuclease family protein [Muribaculaceae bacterium]
TMEGTPLRGLQIMGVAETRALDFDNIIFLSMNDRVFPRRTATKTMLPNNIRAGYGLPLVDRSESDSAYVFYRLIARARNVALIYDSRDASTGSGEASRFIAQLRYLYPTEKLRRLAVNMGANAPEKRVITVEKTADIMRKLDAFRPGGRSYISASALKTFKHCPLKFYLQNVCGMRGEDNVTEYMTSAQYGTILHEAAQRIYEDYKGRPITAAVLKGLSQDVESRYAALVEQIIQRVYYHREAAAGADLPVEGQIVRDLILDFLKSMFGHENKAWCSSGDSFEFLEAEKLVSLPWEVMPGLTINFKMYIDRVDKTAAGLRFIDYKTGGDLTAAASVEALFGDDSRYDAMLQILAYCEAYADIVENLPIQPVLYRFRTMDYEGGILPVTIGCE